MKSKRVKLQNFTYLICNFSENYNYFIHSPSTWINIQLSWKNVYIWFAFFFRLNQNGDNLNEPFNFDSPADNNEIFDYVPIVKEKPYFSENIYSVSILYIRIHFLSRNIFNQFCT